MKKATIQLKSTSPYSQSRFHNLPLKKGEKHDERELRTWREKGHYTANGDMFIPSIAITMSIKEAAKYSNIKVTGKGQSTYTKHFEAGIMVLQDIILPVTKETARMNAVYANANGKKGAGTRVMRFFPTCDQWEGTVDVAIFDDEINREIFEQVANAAGLFIGMGQFRPRNAGYYGRFSVEILNWDDDFVMSKSA